MFSNEVVISEEDKALLMEHIAIVDSILDKYPYELYEKRSDAVTAMSRAKSYTKNAKQWIGYLYTSIEDD